MGFALIDMRPVVTKIEELGVTNMGQTVRALGGLVASGAFALGVCTSVAAAYGDELLSKRFGLYGSPGILDMPTAEVAPDGELSMSHHRFGPVRRSTLTFQITPRLSGSFRYNGTKNLTDDTNVFWDESYDLSYQLFDEGALRPAIAVGMRDFLGAGRLSSEYVVATKSFGERLRVSAGLGWGRLGSANSIGSFGTRDIDTLDSGGSLSTGQWFRGSVGAFGGLTYDLNDRLTLMAEYSSDAYSAEVDRGIVDPATRVNVGLTYALRPNVNLTASYLYGDMIGFGITGHLNPRKPALSGGLETAPLPVKQRPSRAADALGWSGKWIEDGTDAPGIRKALAAAMVKEGMQLQAMSLSATRAEMEFRNDRYPSHAQAVGRLSRLATRAFPPSVETFVMTEVVRGVPVQSTVIRRSALEQLEFAPAGDMLAATEFADPQAIASDPLVAVTGAYPKFKWSVSPYLGLTLFDADSSIRADLGLRGRFSYEYAPGLSLSGASSLKLAGNVDGQPVSSGGADALQPVRSNAGAYSDRVQLDSLVANWYAHPAENIFTHVSVGYLERMFGGVAGEVLWKKPESRFALGAELAYAVQRDYDDPFAFLDYDVMTGHVSGYYDFGNGFHGQLDLGRYLAGDWGGTVTLDREFNNGWRVGAYATFTDVAFEDFGEGAFDKGVRVSMPVSWFVGTPTTETRDIDLNTLSRDGGARLRLEGRLYDQVREAQQGELEDRWGRFWR